MSTQESSAPYKQALREAATFIREGDDFLVVSHVSPDGDAISSTGAMGFILRALGKTYTLINEGKTPEKFMDLLGDQPIVNYGLQSPRRTFTHIIALDCADKMRIGKVQELFAEGASLLNIDHHPTNDSYGTFNVLKPQAAATVEIIFELAQEMQIPWSEPLATCIYAGLLTDTGGFRYANTTPNVMKIAEQMLSLGVRGAELAERLLETMSYEQVQLMKETLSTLTFSDDRKIAWVIVTKEAMERTGALDEDTEGFVNIPRNVAGVEVGMLFKEKDDGLVKVSLRSAGKVDVSKLAKMLGGGGHVRAAGVTVKGSLHDVVRNLLEVVSKEI